jgi:hypothetical protein
MPKVGLSTGVERREILRKAAYYIRSETAKQITARPVIMPRVSPPGSEITRTRGDAIRGILEELIHFHNDEIKYFEFEEIIVCAKPGEIEGMDQFSSAERMKELPIRVENLYEQGPWDEVEIQDVEGNTDTVRVNHRIKDSAFRISVSVPSSDPAFGIYGSLQNMIFAVHPADRARLQGVPEEVALADDRAAAVSSSLLIPGAVQKAGNQPDTYNSTHQTLQERASDYQESEADIGLQYRTLYSNLANLAEHLRPDLAFIDGTYVVDGSGDRLEGGFALSGDDPVAVDAVLAQVLGVDVDGLGHLQYLQQRHFGSADEKDIKVARGNPDDLNIPFSLHPDDERRLSWHHVRLPGEDGEAVGYIAPEQETEQDEGGAEETPEDAESGATEQKDRAGQQEGDQQTAEETTGERPSTESADEGAAAAVEPDEDLDLRERIRRRLIRRGKMEGELPEGAAEAGGASDTQEPEEEASAADEPSEASEETGEPDVEEEEGQGDQQDVQEESQEPAEQQTEEEAGETAASDDQDHSDGGGGTVSGADVVLEGDDVRERVRNRLIQRGKMEGELPEGIDMPEPTTGSGEEDEGEDTAEAEQESEGAKTDQDADQKQEQAEEPSEEDAGGDQQEAPSEEASETEDDGEEAGGTVSGQDVVLEGDDVRERVRNRLIQRGKMEGELPDGIEQPSSPEKDADTGEEQAEPEASGEGESDQEQQDEQQTEDVSQEETEEEGDAEQQEPSAGTHERDEDLDPRERIERRLIRRGKMEGELPDDAEGGAAKDGTEEEPPESASEEELPEVEDADHVDETVEVTTSSGPSLEPSEDISDPQEVLQNLSGYEPEDKIRRRLAIRRRAVQGTAGDNGEAAETTEAQEEPSEQQPDAAEVSEEQTDGEQEAAGDDADQEESEDVSGYTRDPDAPLRDRVEQRLSERGKL